MDDYGQLKLKPNEKIFDVKPVGVAYTCIFCHNGEMEASGSDPFEFKDGKPVSRIHYCNNCGAHMSLPKSYPYIEWIPVKGTITFPKENKNETT